MTKALSISDRNSYANLRAEMACSAGCSDAWGWCMGWWFAIAGAIHDRGDAVPAEWHYRPSPMGGADPDGFEDNTIAELEITTPALIHAGNLLNRYAEFCKRKELDY